MPNTLEVFIIYSVSFFESPLFNSIDHLFKSWLHAVLVFNFLSSLYILDIKTFRHSACMNVFPHFLGCLFTKLTISFAVQKPLNFLRSHLSMIGLFPEHLESFLFINSLPMLISNHMLYSVL